MCFADRVSRAYPGLRLRLRPRRRQRRLRRRPLRRAQRVGAHHRDGHGRRGPSGLLRLTHHLRRAGVNIQAGARRSGHAAHRHGQAGGGRLRLGREDGNVAEEGVPLRARLGQLHHGAEGASGRLGRQLALLELQLADLALRVAVDVPLKLAAHKLQRNLQSFGRLEVDKVTALHDSLAVLRTQLVCAGHAARGGRNGRRPTRPLAGLAPLLNLQVRRKVSVRLREAARRGVALQVRGRRHTQHLDVRLRQRLPRVVQCVQRLQRLVRRVAGVSPEVKQKGVLLTLGVRLHHDKRGLLRLLHEHVLDVHATQHAVDVRVKVADEHELRRDGQHALLPAVASARETQLVADAPAVAAHLYHLVELLRKLRRRRHAVDARPLLLAVG